MEINDGNSVERERLRVALERFHDRAARLAARIADDLPGFTGHDVEHLDALWATADAIVGPGFAWSPLEAYVFGGAALLHDLALTVAAYLDGPESVESGDDWQDALVLAMRDAGEEDSGLVSGRAREAILRRRHAERAHELATVPLRGPEGSVYLVEDEDLREDLGCLMGEIAASHGADASTLPSRFAKRSPTPKDFPASWQVDSFMLACLLRCADAAQLDGRRARAIQQAIQRPQGESADHWNFQRLLHPARLDGDREHPGDRLVFESTRPFPRELADAWWLGYDWLQMADEELRTVDSMLAEQRPARRFAARSVAAADAPERMAERVQTHGWLPIDARMHVSNVASLARKLGGRQLYGSTPAVPLRELLQNGMDAVRAAELLTGARTGGVTVAVRQERGAQIVEVRDTGVGMTPAVLSGPLLDFGSSLWRSSGVSEYLPGLASSGFQSFGRFGIGFFAAFMWSERVTVTSRSYTQGPADTHVLSFTELRARPLLRRADPHERLSEPGTVVQIELQAGLGLGGDDEAASESPQTLAKLIPWLVPAAEVDVFVDTAPQKPKRVIRGGDWRRIKGARLLKRLYPEFTYHDELIGALAENLRPIEIDGLSVGRAAIAPAMLDNYSLGVLVAGGLRVAPCPQLAGVLLADHLNLARTEARPIASKEALRAWATEQATLLDSLTIPFDGAIDCAHTVALCGANPGPLPVAMVATGVVSLGDLRRWAAKRSEVIILDPLQADDISFAASDGLVPAEDVIFVSSLSWQSLSWFDEAESHGEDVASLDLWDLVIDTLAQAWRGVEEISPHGEQTIVGESWAGEVLSGEARGFRRPRCAS